MCIYETEMDGDGNIVGAMKKLSDCNDSNCLTSTSYKREEKSSGGQGSADKGSGSKGTKDQAPKPSPKKQ